MPPKNKYSRKEVVKAAFKVVDDYGLSNLTARRVADRLGSSTAPVYSHFANMEELTNAVIEDVRTLFLDYTRRPYTDILFLNMGTGIAMFACEHRKLYRSMLLETSNYREAVFGILEVLKSDMAGDPRFAAWTAEERQVLLRKMWTFTHGLSSMISAGLLDECSEESIVRTLKDIGRDVIGAAMARHEASLN